MDNIQNITLDIMNNKIYDYIYTKQYDVGRVIKFQITQDHNRMSLDNTSIVFQLSKPDGYVIIESLPIMNNVATLTLTEQCTAECVRPRQQNLFNCYGLHDMRQGSNRGRHSAEHKWW